MGKKKTCVMPMGFRPSIKEPWKSEGLRVKAGDSFKMEVYPSVSVRVSKVVVKNFRHLKSDHALINGLKMKPIYLSSEDMNLASFHFDDIAGIAANHETPFVVESKNNSSEEVEVYGAVFCEPLEELKS